MNLKALIEREHSKRNAAFVADYIGADPDRIEELIHLFLNSSEKLNQKCAYVVHTCFDKVPECFQPYTSQFVEYLDSDQMHVAGRRALVRMLQFLEIPEESMGKAADVCFRFLYDKTQPVAIKAYSMTVLFNICKKYPELKNELKIAIEDLLPEGSAGIKNRGNKLLKQIRKI